MRVVHKYKFETDTTKSQKLSFPRGGLIRHVGLDCDRIPCIWVEFEQEGVVMDREDLLVFGTGMDLPAYARHHIGTFLEGIFVWHVYSRFKLQ